MTNDQPNHNSQNPKKYDLAERTTKFSKDIIDFLKIDCEGGEWDILSNLSDQELKRIKIISLEYHNQYIPNLDKKIIKIGIFVIIAATAITVLTSPGMPFKVFLFTNSTIIEKMSANIMLNITTIHKVESNIFLFFIF
jgi:hypothetical protein